MALLISAARAGEQDRGVAQRSRVPGVRHVRTDRRHEEEAAEHVLALRDPRHGLDAQRMHGEERGHEERPPRRGGGREQHEPQQRGGRRVEDDVDPVMGARLEPERLDRRRMRQPREWVPVAGLEAGEGPAQRLRREPVEHRIALGHVERIVVLEECEAADGCVQRAHEEEQQRSEPERAGRRGRHASAVSVGRAAPERRGARSFSHAPIRTSRRSFATVYKHGTRNSVTTVEIASPQPIASDIGATIAS